ncbi:MAG TPA: hypothetical protein VN132_02385, partial [Bdellovibrio sp.]|nr:hypothetical protein [Bdellovibrio sp.]
MKAMLLSVSLFLFASLSHGALSSQEIPYYGEQFYHDLASGVSNTDLTKELQTILNYYHRSVPGTYDEVSKSCEGEGCYIHVTLGYDRARIFMMGVYYLVKEDNGYALPDVYCGGFKHTSDFQRSPPGPNQIPDGNILNTEHTWPQSKFTNSFDKEMQKSDLHHL